MAHAEPSKSAPQTKLVIRNIGLLLSGDLANPILDADTVVAVGDRIAAVGKEKDVDSSGATITIANASGLPRRKQFGRFRRGCRDLLYFSCSGDQRRPAAIVGR